MKILSFCVPHSNNSNPGVWGKTYRLINEYHVTRTKYKALKSIIRSIRVNLILKRVEAENLFVFLDFDTMLFISKLHLSFCIF